MNWLSLKTEYSFGSVYGPIEQIVEVIKKGKGTAAGICDINGTYGFVEWDKQCRKKDIKPIFGVSLPVVRDVTERDRRGPMNRMSFIAKTDAGLKKIFWLVEQAHNHFYYQPRIGPEHVNQLSPSDVIVLSGVAPSLFRKQITRPFLLEMSPALPIMERVQNSLVDVACVDNWYPRPEDKKIYEPFAFHNSFRMERKTTPMHIMNDAEWIDFFGPGHLALAQRDHLAMEAKARLQKAPLVKYKKKTPGEETDLAILCAKGAADLGVDLSKKKYKKRLKYELELIEAKGYQDYFLVVSDAVKYAKRNMLVGPGRGSSGGSLVCYLLGITTIDPLKYDLVFERFLSPERIDLPDIDCDFPKDKRALVIRYIQKRYDKDNVSQIANVLTLKGKSALNRFAKSFSIPEHVLDDVKNVLIEREPGDADADHCLRDTFATTDAGKLLLDAYPHLKVVEEAEGHCQTSGKHAAGVLVGSEPISFYCGLNTRDRSRVAMIDMREAEALNLLKIDALGLRILTILAEVCDLVLMPYEDLYSLPDGDKKAYQLINNGRLSGIFQFEGEATKKLTRKMKIKSIDDLAAINAASRPGALSSGGASRFVNRKSGKDEITYLADHKALKKITRDTAGVILYQEQVMRILREVGRLPWDQVIFLRKQMAKTLGQESFSKYRKAFIKGARKSGLSKDEAGSVWKNLVTFGRYGFNKSHSVAYALLAYWCAYLKAHHPLEFATASLNHPKSDRSALKLLRDMVENDGIKYVFFDPEKSEAKWSVKDGILYGGFETLKGIGPATAKNAVKARDLKKEFPTLAKKAIKALDSPFKHLYPARALFSKHYKRQTIEIDQINGPGDYIIIGQVMKRTIKNANDPTLIAKRDGFAYPPEEPLIYVTFSLEDDSGEQITCVINRFKYEELAHELVHEAKLEENWFQVKGRLGSGFRALFIDDIRRLS